MVGGGRRSGVVAASAAAVLALVGVLVLTLGLQGRSGPPQPAAAEPVTGQARAVPGSSTSAQPTPRATGAATPTPTSTRTPRAREVPAGPDFDPFLPASAPTKLEIASVGIRSSTFVDLEVGKDGSLEVPGSADEIGLYAAGPTPGQLGPAVLGAHVDSTKGPGIFYRLGAVEKGDRVVVTREDGSRVTFTVDKVAVYPKDEFPTDEVYYGDFTRPEIRLVTCGGPFDPVDHYLSNVIVFGHRTG